MAAARTKQSPHRSRLLPRHPRCSSAAWGDRGSAPGISARRQEGTFCWPWAPRSAEPSIPHASVCSSAPLRSSPEAAREVSCVSGGNDQSGPTWARRCGRSTCIAAVLASESNFSISIWACRSS